ncbi:integrating conjugative element protein (TIGR03758 family) [Bisgaardia hudsonensis]|uniref:Integrating conjugative element protein (TIGR03758 family) n=1 Tax=Bisgaardia hudsonensis TaxID=109472 RepID=A0A4R2N326_9PAST|nr:TIGR03758 family integrating conjugative element protein [Bisgaardia hudsonensis]QLB12781.1 integrating conjugative element protein [Bisgaardia hudsonensis]TCP14334.1 integrating conjugative element protein (TIGR03758 family) [Bisgaardia hudsonensis]
MANSNYSPSSAFSAASGIDPTQLRILLSVIFIAVLLLAYAWAVNSGFKGFARQNYDVLSFLIYLLKGAALLICIIVFFTY